MKGLLMTVNFSMRVGSGTGPVTVDPVRCAVSTICAADWSMSLWSYGLRRIRMRCFAIATLPAQCRGSGVGAPGREATAETRSSAASCDDLRDDARADGVAALADCEAKAFLERDRRDQGDLERRV